MPALSIRRTQWHKRFERGTAVSKQHVTTQVLHNVHYTLDIPMLTLSTGCLHIAKNATERYHIKLQNPNTDKLPAHTRKPRI